MASCLLECVYVVCVYTCVNSATTPPPPSIGAGQTCGETSSQAGAQGNTWVWCRAWKWLEAPQHSCTNLWVYKGGFTVVVIFA